MSGVPQKFFGRSQIRIHCLDPTVAVPLGVGHRRKFLAPPSSPFFPSLISPWLIPVPHYVPPTTSLHAPPPPTSSLGVSSDKTVSRFIWRKVHGPTPSHLCCGSPSLLRPPKYPPQNRIMYFPCSILPPIILYYIPPILSKIQ